MPIPFRDADEYNELGAAAFLHVAGDEMESSAAGGVLLVDARGEPLEMVHHWTSLPSGVLWSAAEAWRYTMRHLTADLLRAVGRTPHVLLVEEGPSNSPWLNELEIGIPVGVVGTQADNGPVEARWLNGHLQAESAAALLYDRLARRQLLAEPFDRVRRVIRELYPTVTTGSGDERRA